MNCDGCQKSGECVEVDRHTHPGLRFQSKFLGRSVVECFDWNSTGANEVTALIGMNFDSYNVDFVDALRMGWITCEGEITSSGRVELERKRPAKRSDVPMAKGGNGRKVIQLGRKARA